MESTRETKKFITKNKHKVVYKTYATGREFNEIQSIYMSQAKMKFEGEEVKLIDFDTSIHFKAMEKTVEILVVSLNGSTENVLERCLDLPSDDYNEIVDLVSAKTNIKKK